MRDGKKQYTKYMTDRQTGRLRETEYDRQTGRLTETDRQSDRQSKTDRLTDIGRVNQTYWQTKIVTE